MPELWESLPEEVKKLREEILTAYRSASSHDTLGGETTTLRGSAYLKLLEGKACEVPVVWDSGCTKDIVSEGVVRALGAHIN